jgi:hypothetical protein
VQHRAVSLLAAATALLLLSLFALLEKRNPAYNGMDNGETTHQHRFVLIELSSKN